MIFFLSIFLVSVYEYLLAGWLLSFYSLNLAEKVPSFKKVWRRWATKHRGRHDEPHTDQVSIEVADKYFGAGLLFVEFVGCNCAMGAAGAAAEAPTTPASTQESL